MLKNLNEKDKKKIYAMLSMGVVCAIVLIAMPSTSSEGEDSENIKNNEIKEQSLTQNMDSLEDKLKNILSQIQGAGELDVMITYEASEEIQPAFNTNSSTEKTEEKDKSGGERTVTTSSENKTMITSGSNEPIVIKTTEPKIKGVIVVASGANDSQVKETLYNAVQTALQIQGHQVEIYSK